MQRVSCNKVALKIPRICDIAYFPSSPTNAYIAKSNSCFWGFFGLGLFPFKVAFFAIIIVENLTDLLLFLASSTVGIYCVETHRSDRVQLLFLVFFFFLEFLLLFFMTLFSGFRASRVVVSLCSLEFLGLELRLLVPKIFHWVVLNLNLNCYCINRTESLFALVINFMVVWYGLNKRLSLNFNCFHNNLFLGVEFSPLLLHLGFNRGLEIFPKKSNKIRLFWSSINIKF